MAYNIDYNPSACLVPGGHPFEDPYPDDAASVYTGEPEILEQPAEIESISLTKIDRAKVVYALIEGAAKHLVMQAAREDEQPPEDIHVPKVTVIDRHLKALRRELAAQAVPKADWTEVLLDDHPLEGTPRLPGFKPLAGDITAETITELDTEYGAGFTVHCLQELLDERDERAARKAAASKVAGPTILGACLEAPSDEADATEQDLWADNAENEFAFRWRADHLYVGDIPFHIWYSHLHAAAAKFVQELRSSGREDLPDVKPIDPDDLREQVIKAKSAGLPLVMHSRTGLPVLTNRDTDLNIPEINQAFRECGYDENLNFAYEALRPVLEAAPFQRGPLRERQPVPAPRMPEGRAEWVKMAQDTGDMSRTQESPALRPGTEGHDYATALTHANVTSQPDARRMRADPATDRPTVMLSSAGRLSASGQPHQAPDTVLLMERENDDYEGGLAMEEGHAPLKPSDRTRARIRELNVAMYESSGPIPWSIAGLERWGRFLMLGVQRITRN